MIGLYINIVISLIFIIPFLKKDTSNDVFVIWGCYFISSVLSLYLDPTTMSGFKKAESYNFIYFIVYGLLVSYALSPLYTIRKTNDRPQINNYSFSLKEKRILNFAILGGLFSIIYTLPYAFISISLGAKEVRSSVLVLETTTVLPQNILTTIAVAFATFSSIYLGVFFLSLKSNLTKFKIFFLFIISLSYVVISFCYTARDGLLFFVIFGLIFVLNYWNEFSKKIRKRVLYFSLIIVFGSIYTLKVFTEDRFDDSTNGTLGYIATQPYVFAENIERRSETDKDYFYGLSLRFPILNSIFGIENKVFYREEQYEWTFGTFLTDFYNVNGFFSLIFFLIFFTEFFRYYLKKSKHNTMKFSLTYTFYIHFIISGLFYFRLGNFSGNVYILVLMFLIISQKKNIT